MCLKCVERTPVGYRCRECLGAQRHGYYNATPADYIVAAIVGSVVAAIAGFIMGLLGGFWLLAIFAGPIGGGAIAESMRTVVHRHRGRYLWLVACAVVIGGGILGAAGLRIFAVLGTGHFAALLPVALGSLFNLGFLIYVALAVSTAYARLRV